MSLLLYMSQNNISISKEVKTYLKRKPCIQESIEQEIVNYSALSRKIAKDLGDVSFEAVKSTLIRIANKTNKEKRCVNKKLLIFYAELIFQ